MCKYPNKIETEGSLYERPPKVPEQDSDDDIFLLKINLTHPKGLQKPSGPIREEDKANSAMAASLHSPPNPKYTTKQSKNTSKIILKLNIINIYKIIYN